MTLKKLELMKIPQFLVRASVLFATFALSLSIGFFLFKELLQDGRQPVANTKPSALSTPTLPPQPYVLKASDIKKFLCAEDSEAPLVIKWNSSSVQNLNFDSQVTLGTVQSGPCRDFEIIEVLYRIGESSCKGARDGYFIDGREYDDRCPNEMEYVDEGPYKRFIALQDRNGKKLIFLMNSAILFNEYSDPQHHERVFEKTNIVSNKHFEIDPRNFENFKFLYELQSLRDRYWAFAKNGLFGSYAIFVDNLTMPIKELFPPQEVKIENINFFEVSPSKRIDLRGSSSNRPSLNENVFFDKVSQERISVKVGPFYFRYASPVLNKVIDNYIFAEIETPDDKDLRKVGDYLEYKSASHPAVSSLYEGSQRYVDFFNKHRQERLIECNQDKECIEKIPPEQKPTSLTEFHKLKPIIFWRDPLGRNQKFVRRAVTPPIFEEPLVYLYGQIGDEYKIYLQAPLQILRAVPNYQAFWHVAIAPSEQLLDLKTQEIYSSLYWEGTSFLLDQPSRGWVLSTTNVEQGLRSIVKQLGFNKNESRDFVNYWTPKLKKHPYVKVFLIDSNIINFMAPVEIVPAPRNFARFHFLFEQADVVTETLLPPDFPALDRTPPFALEWSGFVYRTASNH